MSLERAAVAHTTLRFSLAFAVNGTGIPEVTFDVGESYSGQLPISSDPKEESKFFWWFFPSTNPAAEKEILIWLNGGVSGCPLPDGVSDGWCRKKVY